MVTPAVSADRGLSTAEVADRVARGLVNAVPAAPTRTVGQIVRGNVLTPINLIIGILAALVLAAGSPKDALFAGVIVANSVIGVVQELRAKRVLDSLSVVNAPRARAVRDGEVVELHLHELVLDDVVELRAGAQVVADGEVLVDDNLEIDESLLTGEADAVVKRAGDEVLSGSAVVAGTGRVRVNKVGAENYAAKLADEARRFTLVNSPLRNDVNRIVTWVGVAIVPVGLLLASSQFVRRDERWQEAVISTVAGLVGMVPEGLVLLTSVAFAVGVVRLAKQRCLVQELPAIEVLARVDVLCADKTGTITEGSLALAAVETVGADVTPDDVDAVLAAMATLDPDPNATVRALAERYAERSSWTLSSRTPFNSSRKWSSMTFDESGTWVLGAPENVLGNAWAGELRTAVEGHAADGRRVLVLARAAVRDETLHDVRPVALALFEDVVRADAPDTLRYFADQGVTLKVISGDNDVTVGAVARRAGLQGWERNVNAQTLPDGDGDDGAFADAIEGSTVFGRVTPHQKRAMVKALQRRGHVVAMTGDGVNDVLALKDADCGVAMASGSEATRGVAQLVLLDSNFSALPAVVAEGRRVINNIERVATLFLAKTTYSLVLSVLTGVFALRYPLRPIHLSILSWFTIGVPAFFLALEPNADRVQPGFLRRVLGRSVPAGLVIAGATMGVFAIAQLDDTIDADHARSVAVLVAGSVALMNLYRVARPLNRLRAVLVVVMVVAFAAAFVVPWARDLFELPVTRGWAYGLAAGTIVLAWPLLELGSRVARRVGHHEPVR
ncbi:MAG: HAD-IC family P-type ATPase [Acidimicrobiales bacterium]|nr:HAD-IC family P-type ATPase [Acidimicrobiales bacterium]MCB9392518.1 HAD-IC family P-type ATPase [Acidimicrobiaceae bacterium]